LTTARRTALGALLLSLAAAGCTDWAGYDVDVAAGKVPAFSTMRRNVVPDPYGMLRLPAPHSIPVQSPMGELPEHFSSDRLDSVAATLRNPYAGGANAAVLARGKVEFNNNCYVCHGPAGAGNGPVVQPATGANGKTFGRFPGAPAINGAITAAKSDGYIYGVMAAGRGLMPPYGFKLPEPDRWAVVEYVRSLQAAAGNAPQRGGSAPPTPAARQPPAPAAAGSAARQPATTTTQPPAAAPAPAPAPAAPPAPR
jgi:mono/diheme cytochrome c family protein